MSVVSVTTKYATNRGTADVHGRRQYTIVLIVDCDSTSDTEQTIYAAVALGIPVKYQAHPADSGALCKQLDPHKIAELANGHAIWEVVCKYDSKFDREQHPNQDVANPLNRPTVFTWAGAIYTETQFKDLDGKAYVNTAGPAVGGQRMGDPLDPPPLTEQVHGIITATRNVASFDEAKAESYRNKVNSDTWRGHAKDTCKIAVYGAHGPLYENGVEFFSENIEIHTNRRKWIPLEVLNAGPRHLKEDTDTVPVLGEDDDGTKSTVPVLLAADGTKLADDADPYYLEFRQYERAAFGPLNL